MSYQDFVDSLDVIACCARNAVHNPHLGDPEVRRVLIALLESELRTLKEHAAYDEQWEPGNGNEDG